MVTYSAIHHWKLFLKNLSKKLVSGDYILLLLNSDWEERLQGYTKPLARSFQSLETNGRRLLSYIVLYHEDKQTEKERHTADQYPHAHGQGRGTVLPDASQFQDANPFHRGHRKACQDDTRHRSRHNKRGKRGIAHRTLTGLLRSTTFSHIYGEKLPIGVRPSVNTRQFIDRYNRGWFTDKLNNEDFRLHFQSLETFYFFGTPRIKDEYTLVMGDIDVLKSQGLGSPEGALAFVEYLKATIWPDLYFEPSTNGNGIHFYSFMRKAGVGAERVNRAIEKLQDFLRYQDEITGADIELVEVKGKCPEIAYDDDGKITKIKYGTFAKYPRNAKLDDLKNTTVIDCMELHRINGKYAVPEMFEKLARPKLHEGSGSTYIPDDFVAENLDSCRKTWLNLIGGEVIKGYRYLVHPDDAAVVLLVALWLQDHGTKDHRHSVRTTLAFWDNLQSRNWTNRSPNHHRIKTIRDYLSSRGCVDWLDNKYQPPSDKEQKDGICCKWRLDDAFSALLRERGDNVGTDFMGQGENLRPQMRLLREEEAMKKEKQFWEAADREMEVIFGNAA